MDPSLSIREGPPLHPIWLGHEQKAGLLEPQPTFASPADRQPIYAQACKERNALMLAGRASQLTQNIDIHDAVIKARDGYEIKTRTYTPADHNLHEEFIIYYHGGGLIVGDLDSEDLSCRRICIENGVTVISVDYRLMPQYPPQKALDDAYDAFQNIISTDNMRTRRLVLVGSSSGAQLAAQVSQLAQDTEVPSQSIGGLLLRCPVTVDAREGGVRVPERFKDMHTSFAPSFDTSLLKIDGIQDRETMANLPLQATSFKNLPKTFIQVCSNDIYYSDGICYAAALREAGVEVDVEVLHGWPHTFWLKAPQLDQALEAEKGMVKAIRWLFDDGDNLV